jgi:CO/xanthine dehydrogenase FAD-binding subunit
LSGLEPFDDIEVSATYRRRVAVTLAIRALRDANEEAGAT